MPARFWCSNWPTMPARSRAARRRHCSMSWTWAPADAGVLLVVDLVSPAGAIARGQLLPLFDVVDLGAGRTALQAAAGRPRSGDADVDQVDCRGAPRRRSALVVVGTSPSDGLPGTGCAAGAWRRCWPNADRAGLPAAGGRREIRQRRRLLAVSRA